LSKKLNEQDQMRKAAEARLASLPKLKPRPAKELLHELQVHQIELEMQNETLRQSQISLEESRDRYVDFYDFSPVGYITLSREALISEINLTGATLLGEARSKLLNRRFSPFVAPEDKDLWHQHFMAVLQHDSKHSCELKILREDGSHLHVQLDSLHLESDGNKFIVRVVMTDITERKLAEAALRESEKRRHLLEQQEIVHTSLDGFWVVNAKNGQILEVNDNYCKMVGYSREEILAMRIHELDADETPEETEARIKKIREIGYDRFEARHRHKQGHLIDFEVNVSNSKIDSSLNFAFFCDITERKQAEQSQRKLTRAFKLLSECGTLLIYAKNERELLEEICQLAVVTGGYLMAWVGFAEHDADKTVRPIAQSGYEEGYLDSIKVTWSDTELGRGPTGTAIRTRAAVVNQDCQTNPKMAPWREAAIKRGYHSSIGLPLVGNGQVLGALTIYSADPLAFSNEEVALLNELADNLSYGIGTLRTRIAQERAELESRELTQHLLTVREEEKTRIAREIHDDLGSTLAALKMDASWLANKLPAETKMQPLLECSQSMLGLLDSAVISIRRIIADLRPTILDNLGLLEALKWQADQFHNHVPASNAGSLVPMAKTGTAKTSSTTRYRLSCSVSPRKPSPILRGIPARPGWKSNSATRTTKPSCRSATMAAACRKSIPLPQPPMAYAACASASNNWAARSGSTARLAAGFV
jgi:PAS domain S-box-containing protein